MSLTLLVSMRSANACTVFAATGQSTANGASLLMHTDDCLNCDFRIVRAPPARSGRRPVLQFRETYPREVSDRSPMYNPGSLDQHLPPSLLNAWSSAEWAANRTLGYMEPLPPDVALALGALNGTDDNLLGAVEGLYAIVNTAQVAVAESTSSAHPSLFSLARPHLVAGAEPAGHDKGALWDISALTKAALARCPTARCAVDLMGCTPTPSRCHSEPDPAPSEPE